MAFGEIGDFFRSRSFLSLPKGTVSICLLVLLSPTLVSVVETNQKQAHDDVAISTLQFVLVRFAAGTLGGSVLTISRLLGWTGRMCVPR